MNMRIDPRLMIPEDVASRIAAFVVPNGAAFMTDIYPFALAAETQAGEPYIRAATADEVTALLTTGGFPPEKGVDWPGDPAVPTGSPVTWQRRQADEPAEEEGCRLYAGEVVLRSGRGIAGPFFIHEQAARSWALVAALELSESEVHEAQVVPYACVRRPRPPRYSVLARQNIVGCAATGRPLSGLAARLFRSRFQGARRKRGQAS